MTKAQRKWHQCILLLIPSPKKRTQYLKIKKVFGHIGEKCFIQSWQIPLYSNLIYLHNNVKIASNVNFVTHDIIHSMLNAKYSDNPHFIEKIDCIEIMDNVFIGSGSRILYGVRIGTNVIIGANTLVNKDVPNNCVFAGVPGRVICSFDEYVKKAEVYSKTMKQCFGVDRIEDVDTCLANGLYQHFCDERKEDD